MQSPDKLTAYVTFLVSIVGIIFAALELPSNPALFNIILAISISSIVLVLFLLYSRGSISQDKDISSRELQSETKRDEKKFEQEFPRIFAFVNSIDLICSQQDFEKLETQLDYLIYAEKRNQDIDAVRAIALAKLIRKKRF